MNEHGGTFDIKVWTRMGCMGGVWFIFLSSDLVGNEDGCVGTGRKDSHHQVRVVGVQLLQIILISGRNIHV
jgi:hypothetical protein